MTFSKLNVRVSISVLALSLSACTGDFSLNSEQIQEIAASQPGGKSDVLVKNPGCGKIGISNKYLWVVQFDKHDIDSRIDRALEEKGYKARKSENVQEYMYKPDGAKCDEPILSIIDTQDIHSAEEFKDADSILDYDAEGHKGIIILRMERGTAPKLIPSE